MKEEGRQEYIQQNIYYEPLPYLFVIFLPTIAPNNLKIQAFSPVTLVIMVTTIIFPYLNVSGYPLVCLLKNKAPPALTNSSK